MSRPAIVRAVNSRASFFAALAFAGLPVYGQNVYIGVNFTGGGGSPLPPTEVTAAAGLFSQTNWNNVAGTTSTDLILNDASGVATPVTLSFTTAEIWGSGTGNATGNHQLFNGYINPLDNATNTVSLANVPVGFYDLVLYTLRDGSGAGGGYSTSASGTVYHINSEGAVNFNANPTFRRATSTDPGARQLGNYVQWSGLGVTGGNLSFSITSENFRAPVNGFQLLTAASKTWSGGTGPTASTWDTTSANFTGTVFQQGDSVFFNDTNGNGQAVTLRNITIQPGGVSPAGMIVNNSAGGANAYTFTGALNTSLTKMGTGDLTLAGPTSSGLRVDLQQGSMVINKTEEVFTGLLGNGNIQAGPAMTKLTLGSAGEPVNVFSGSLTQGAVPMSLVKAGGGRQTLSGALTYTGTTTINGGLLELSGPAKIFNAGTITINGAGTRVANPAGGPQVRTGALIFNTLDIGSDPLGTTPIIMNGGEFGSSGSTVTVGSLTSAKGLNSIGAYDFSPVTVTNFTRSVGSTVEFKGANGQLTVTNINGVATANDAGGILGGWAISYNGDGAPWDSYWATSNAGVVSPFGNFVGIAGATPTDNVRVDGGGVVNTPGTTTINSLVVRNNDSLNIDAAATVLVNSGGVIVTYGNNANQIGGGGNLTTGLASGELFLHSYDQAFASTDGDAARFGINANIVNNGATPTMVVKSGYGPLRLGGANTYTGGTMINFGILQIRNSGALGTGPVTVQPGAQLQFGPGGLSVANNVTLNGPNAMLVGGMDGVPISNTLAGDLTLNGTGIVTSYWADKVLTIEGKVTGPGGLDVIQYRAGNAGTRVVLTNPLNDYAGDTRVLPGDNADRPVLRAGAANVIPGGTGKGNVVVNATLELQSFSQSINGLSGSGRVFSSAGGTILTLGGNNASSDFAGQLQGTNGDLIVTKTGTGTQTLSGTIDNASVRGVIQQGSVVLAKTSTAGVHAFSGINEVSAGATVKLGGTGGDQIYDGAGFGVQNLNGTFDLNGLNEGISSLSGTGNVTNTAASTVSTLSVGTTVDGINFDSSTFGGAFQDGAGKTALTKIGTGTLTLTGVSTHTGATTIETGTMLLTNPASTNPLANSSIINVGPLTTLDVAGLSGGGLTVGAQKLGGSGTIAGSVTTLGTSTLSPGYNGSIGTLSMGNLTIANGTTLEFVLGTPGTVPAPGLSSKLSVADLNLGTGLVFKPVDNGGANGQGSLTNGTYSIFSYSGTLTGFNAGTTFVESSPGSFAFSNLNGQIYVTVDGLVTLAWTGATNGTWDTTTTNWAAGTTPTTFSTGANVAFGDTTPVPPGGPITNTTITIPAGGVQPGAVAFTNSAVNYTLTSTDAAGISGPASVVKSGTGTLVLQGANTLTGAVSVSGGAISVANAGALGNASSVTVGAGSVLQLQGGLSITTAIPINLNGTGLAASPAGALQNVSGDNTYTGPITVATSATVGSTVGTLTLPGTVNTNGNTLTATGDGNVVLSGVISGTGSLAKTGTGTLSVNAINTFSGGTTVSGGILRLGNVQALGANNNITTITPGGAVDLNGQNIVNRRYRANIAGNGTGAANVGTIFNSGNGSIDASFDAITLSANASIGSNGNRFDIGRNNGGLINEGGGFVLTKVGTNLTAVLNATTNLAGIVINGGTFIAEHNEAYGTNSLGNPTPVTVNAGATSGTWGDGRTLANPITLNGGTIRQDQGGNSFHTYNGPVDVQAGGGTFQTNAGAAPFGTMQVNGSLSGSGPLAKTGGGLVNLAADNRLTYTGTLSVNEGRVVPQVEGALGSGTIATNATGTLDIATSGIPQTLGSLAGTGGRVEIGATTLTVGSNNSSTSYGGTIAGSGGLTKIGTGTLTLTGANSYTGVTAITAGTLKLADSTPSQPGLFEGKMTGANNVTDPIPRTNVNLTTLYANSTDAGAFGNDSTWGYSGVFFNSSGTTQAITFGEHFDDNVLLKVDGNTVLNNQVWDGLTTSTINITPGAHVIELRLGQGGGGVGPPNGNLGGYGVAFSLTGPTGPWLPLTDPGDGSLLSTGTDLSVAVPATSPVVMSSNTTFDVNGNITAVGSLASVAAATNHSVMLGVGKLTTGGDNTSTAFAGVISGAGSVVKNGTGTWTLSGANTYTGETAINGGTLLLTGSISGAVNVNAGGTLGGIGTIAGATGVIGGNLAPGTTVGTLTTGALSLNAASTSRFELTLGNTTIGGGINDLVIVNGALTLDGTLIVTELGGSLAIGASYVLFDYSGTLIDSGLNIDPAFLATHPNAQIEIDTVNTRVLLATIPEPGTAVSLLGGCSVLLGLQRFRRTRRG